MGKGHTIGMIQLRAGGAEGSWGEKPSPGVTWADRRPGQGARDPAVGLRGLWAWMPARSKAISVKNVHLLSITHS